MIHHAKEVGTTELAVTQKLRKFSAAPNWDSSSPEEGAPTPESEQPKQLPQELHVPWIRTKL